MPHTGSLTGWLTMGNGDPDCFFSTGLYAYIPSDAAVPKKIHKAGTRGGRSRARFGARFTAGVWLWSWEQGDRAGIPSSDQFVEPNRTTLGLTMSSKEQLQGHAVSLLCRRRINTLSPMAIAHRLSGLSEKIVALSKRLDCGPAIHVGDSNA
jgi:hypothetical protein